MVQGIAVCFDAKECHSDTFPLQNIHEHQMKFMEQYEKQQGIAFILIHFTQSDVFYYLRYRELLQFHQRALEGGRKSFCRNELDANFFFHGKQGLFVPYLDLLQMDLNERDA